MSPEVLKVSVSERSGADTCTGQKIARCCLGNICIDAPVDSNVKSGAYSVEDALRDPSLRFCVEAIRARALTAAKSAFSCHPHESNKCVSRFVEYISLIYGGPVLLVGYSERVANALDYIVPEIYVYDPARVSPKPVDFVDDDGLKRIIDKVGVVIIAPGAATSVDVKSIVERARQAGKPVIAYGVSFAGLAKQLGVLHFCPYGRF
ncbi:hypothetical protein [Thermoproteus tenax]|uniref:Heavy-metal chelation domain-containing protein n=1 Tax=Thermoproteus tenax (strain ATCC 35583 / DSM 2078 / JCM 9277 / NBRC 100435 / Kra 1) TaxID=768679 RepID=G4RPM5_THETK|nr:hypothetical protein [Thermoproteus tenax]CCC81520.1 conserved hypothetical protein [Thermoproteus tenax Kra 1]